jgi:hypothetical protein
MRRPQAGGLGRAVRRRQDRLRHQRRARLRWLEIRGEAMVLPEWRQVGE